MFDIVVRVGVVVVYRFWFSIDDVIVIVTKSQTTVEASPFIVSYSLVQYTLHKGSSSVRNLLIHSIFKELTCVGNLFIEFHHHVGIFRLLFACEYTLLDVIPQFNTIVQVFIEIIEFWYRLSIYNSWAPFTYPTHKLGDLLFGFIS